MNNMMNNNIVAVTGTVVTGLEFSHEVLGEKFYTMTVAVARKSETDDFLPVLVSERLVDITKNYVDEQVKIQGQYRSCNVHTETTHRLVLQIFAREFEVVSKEEWDSNSIELNGFICKQPVYRTTPLGREICDVLVAVNRAYGKSDYIPCVVWGRNAKYLADQKIGAQISLSGRIQSREYVKKMDELHSETRTAYEVSVAKVEVVKEMEV